MLRLAVPDLISNSYFPAIAAVELGCMRARGLEVTHELIFPVTRAMAALRAGEVDFVAGSAHSTLTAFSRWQGAKLLVALGQHMYWCLVLHADLQARRGDLSAVRGLRIGAAPGVDLGLRGMLLEAGIVPERDGVQIAPVPGAAGAGVSFGVTAAQALEARHIDGFWANSMGTEVALRRGVGTLVADVRRGDGPPGARGYTFPALVTTDTRLASNPEVGAAAVCAVIDAQRLLREDTARATPIGRKLFPPVEAELIETLIARDLPYYDPSISAASVASMNAFATRVGLLDADATYEQVVATQYRPLWTDV